MIESSRIERVDDVLRAQRGDTLVHQPTVPLHALGDNDNGADACGVDESGANVTLPEGARLDDCEVIGVIGRGGFSIVYLAYDNLLGQHVAIKEYLPMALAARAPLSPHVIPRSHRSREAFGVGLRSFINEARLLANFNHPALIKVLRFWEANGTAYMAMPYYRGPTLAQELGELGRAPDEEELLRLMRPLLDGLAAMHAVNCFHRDVAPDNILLTDEGPLLLDFGAARRVVGNLTHDLSAVVKPGFTPIEQYAENPSLKQGPWTDLYALAAVAYAAVTGKVPQPSVDRLKDDRLVPLVDLARGRYSPQLLMAIDGALAIHPVNRPQNAAEFWRAPHGEVGARDAAAASGEAISQGLAADFEPEPEIGRPALPEEPRPITPLDAKPGRSRMPLYVLLGMSIALVLAVIGYRLGSVTPPPMVSRLRPPEMPRAPATTPSASSTPAESAPTASPAPGHAREPGSAPATSLPSAISTVAPVVTQVPDVEPAGVVASVATLRSDADGKPERIPRGAPSRSAGNRARCAEILQSASLGPLNDEESAFLNSKCHR